MPDQSTSAAARCEASWNAFWFHSPLAVSATTTRVLCGLLSCWWVASYWGQLDVWLGSQGVFGAAWRQHASEFAPDTALYRLSLTAWVPDGWGIGLLVLATLAVLLATALGIGGRWMALAGWLLMLSVVQRTILVGGNAAPLLTAMLGYGCLSSKASRRAWPWQARHAEPLPQPRPIDAWDSLGVRLLQIHVALFYVLCGTSKLAAEVWWTGEAGWLMLARTESRLVDLTFLHRFPLLLAVGCNAILAVELLFPVVVWRSAWRRGAVAAAVVHWIVLGMVTGEVLFTLTMLAATLSFFTDDDWATIRRGKW